jgi:aquaporin related protein
MANPGQDGDIENDPTQNPDHEIAQVVEQRQAEVKEIQAIEEEGGFDALTDISAEPSVLDSEGVVEGVRDGDEIQIQRNREGEEDLEAQWKPPVPLAGSTVLGAPLRVNETRS